MDKKDLDKGKSILKNLDLGDFDLNLNDPANFSNKVASEYQTRQAMLKQAKRLGCEYEMRSLFNKYDNLLRNCSNHLEREGIAQLGAYEIGNLLNYTEFAVNGVTVIKK
jgi:hypothetical protein